MLELVDTARADGQDVTFDSYPSEWASTRLLILIPPWVQAGGPARTKERLAERKVRDRIRRELGARGTLFAGSGGLAGVRVGYFGRPEHARWEGWTLGQIQAETGTEAVDLVCDLLLSEDLRLNEVTPGPSRATMPPFFEHPVGMVGTDRSSSASGRVRGRTGRFPGSWASSCATRLSQPRGGDPQDDLRPGRPAGHRRPGPAGDRLLADVVVFDPLRIRSLATIDDPRRYPEGIDHVIVNGVPVVEDGRHTGATPAGRSATVAPSRGR